MISMISSGRISIFAVLFALDVSIGVFVFQLVIFIDTSKRYLSYTMTDKSTILFDNLVCRLNDVSTK